MRDGNRGAIAATGVQPSSNRLHLVSVDEASLLLHRSVRTIRYWQAQGKMPKRVKMGKRQFYVQEELERSGLLK